MTEQQARDAIKADGESVGLARSLVNNYCGVVFTKCLAECSADVDLAYAYLSTIVKDEEA